MEIAPLSLHKTTHAAASRGYDPLIMAKYIFGEIEKKSKKYKGKLPIVLLSYITNHKFLLDDTTKYLVSFFCHKGKVRFAEVFLLTPKQPPFEDQIDFIYPRPDIDFTNFNPEDHSGWVINL